MEATWYTIQTHSSVNINCHGKLKSHFHESWFFLLKFVCHIQFYELQHLPGKFVQQVHLVLFFFSIHSLCKQCLKALKLGIQDKKICYYLYFLV